MATPDNDVTRDRIFISYRRDDATGASGRLYDWLRIGLGRERVFRDVASIGIGKWREKIDAALARSGVCVAVIGRRWADKANLRKLNDEDDMVRYEIASVLNSEGVSVVPTLVEGAAIPKIAELPAVLRPLITFWNVREVSENGWEDHTRRLVAEISGAARLEVDPKFDEWLRDAGVAHQRAAEPSVPLRTDQIDAVGRSLDALTRQLADASSAERPSRAAALAAVARGDTLVAEDLFARECEAQSREYAAVSQRIADDGQRMAEARQRMADAARNVANLALQRDINKAVTFYRKALAADPQHAETARLLGLALMLAGDLLGAREAFEISLEVAVSRSDEWAKMAAQVGLGDVLVAQGDGAGALAAYRRGLAIAETLAARDPANTQWQRDLSVSHERIGDVLVAQGDGAGALAAYRRGLAIAETLAARDPANTQWQRDRSVSHERIGDVLVAQGDGLGALAAYRRGLAIRETLAARDPANTQWQRDLSVSHERIGDVLVAQGDGAGALVAHRRGLAIAETLPARDPANAQWQIDLAVSYARLGVAQEQAIEERRGYLLRGREILIELHASGRLLRHQNEIEWFTRQLAQLGSR